MEGHTYNPEKGTEYRNEFCRIVFTVRLSGERWQLLATNVNNPEEWLILAWDGTNSYALRPGPISEGEAPATNTVLWGTVYASPLWLLDTEDPYYISSVWVAYCFRPAYISPDSRGRLVAPRFGRSRDNVRRFGYQWQIVPSADGKTVEMLRLVRDRTLDLPEMQEFLRPEQDLSANLSDFNFWREMLAFNRATPDGFVSDEYVCLEHLLTNGWHITKHAELVRYMDTAPGKPWQRRVIRATDVEAFDQAFQPVPVVPAPTRVVDYRYRRLENHRLFLRATYMLQPGEPWRGPNDPELLAQAEEYIRNGPRYDAFLRPQMRHYLTWLAYAALVIVPLAAYALRRRLPRGTPPRT